MKTLQERYRDTSFTAFVAQRLLAHGLPWDVAVAAKHAIASQPDTIVLVFDDSTGAVVDLDLRGSDAEVKARLKPAGTQPATPEKPKAGRPKLGVVAKEITLLPRHWDWLSRQPGGASATLRKLVNEARRANPEGDAILRAQTTANTFMTAMLGDQPHYEEASRALFASKATEFRALTINWPIDLRDHLWKLSHPAFALPKD